MRYLLDKHWLSFAYIAVLVLLMNLNLKGVDSSVESLSWVGAGGACYFILACLAWNLKKKVYTKFPDQLDTLEKRPDSRVLFDSTKIPGQIIDMVP